MPLEICFLVKYFLKYFDKFCPYGNSPWGFRSGNLTCDFYMFPIVASSARMSGKAVVDSSMEWSLQWMQRVTTCKDTQGFSATQENIIL